VYQIDNLVYYAEQKAAGRELPKRFADDDVHQVCSVARNGMKWRCLHEKLLLLLLLLLQTRDRANNDCRLTKSIPEQKVHNTIKTYENIDGDSWGPEACCMRWGSVPSDGKDRGKCLSF